MKASKPLKQALIRKRWLGQQLPCKHGFVSFDFTSRQAGALVATASHHDVSFPAKTS